MEEALRRAEEARAAAARAPSDDAADAGGGAWGGDMRVAADFWVGSVLALLGRKPEAVDAFESALKRVAEPERLHPDDLELLRLGSSIRSSLCKALQDVGRSDEAGVRARETLDRRRRISERAKQSAQDRRELLVAWDDLCEWLRGAGRIQESLAEAEQALRSASEAAARWPDVPALQERLAASEYERASALEFSSRFAEAREGFERARAIWRVAPPDRRISEEAILTSLGVARNAKSSGDLAGALAAADEAVTAADAAARSAPDVFNAERNRGVARIITTDVLTAADRPAEAAPRLEEAVAVFARLSERWPTTVEARRLHGVALQRRGDLLRDARRFEEALAVYGDTSRELEAALVLRPKDPDIERSLYVTSQRRGSALLELRRSAEALEAFLDQRRRIDSLATAHPQWPELRLDRASNASNVGTTLRLLGRPSEAAREYAEAVERLEALSGQFEAAFHLVSSARRHLLQARAEASPESTPSSPSEWLGRAYSALDKQENRKAAEDFEKALVDEGLRSDLRVGHLYNAACAAARMAGERPDQRAAWTRKACDLLQDLIERCTARLRSLDEFLRTAPAGSERDRLVWERTEHVETLSDGLPNDPDFEAVRADPRFRELLERASKAASPGK
jgi:tetratricopeptide (TPR) repeat protein